MEWFLVFAGAAALLIVTMVVVGARRSRRRSHLDPRDGYFGDREARPPHGPFDSNTDSSF
ncbi:hypothetical protein ACFQZ4_47640 [Catellatospora coxensis]